MPRTRPNAPGSFLRVLWKMHRMDLRMDFSSSRANKSLRRMSRTLMPREPEYTMSSRHASKRRVVCPSLADW